MLTHSHTPTCASGYSLMFHSTPDPQTGTLIPASRIPMHYHSSLPQSAQIAAAWQGSVWDTQRGDKQEKVMLVSPAHAASHCQAWDGCCGRKRALVSQLDSLTAGWLSTSPHVWDPSAVKRSTPHLPDHANHFLSSFPSLWSHDSCLTSIYPKKYCSVYIYILNILLYIY